MDVIMAGRLATADAYPAAEWVAIKNISGHGARIISGKRWRTHEQVCLGETVGDQHLDAKVVYCVPLDGDRYAVGLKFTTVTESYEAVNAPMGGPQEPVQHARAP